MSSTLGQISMLCSELKSHMSVKSLPDLHRTKNKTKTWKKVKTHYGSEKYKQANYDWKP